MSYSYSADAFKEARPINTFAKIALAGAQNSGKTVSALRIAAGLGGETAIIDSENKRSLKYATAFRFKHFDLQPPYCAENYEAAINAAAKAGFNNVIVDSMSHEHEGIGGMLDQVESYLARKTADIEDEKAREKKRDQLKFSAFIAPKQARNRLIQFGIQRVQSNVILCFRAKEKIEMKKEKWTSADGMKSGEKTVPTPVGIQPIGGEEFYFEMDYLAILGEGSNGKPDWTQQASRINEFPRGRVTEYLHSVQQFNEDVGRRLKEFCTVIPDAPYVLKTTSSATGFDTPEAFKEAVVALIPKLTKPAQFDNLTKLNSAAYEKLSKEAPEVFADLMAAITARKTELANTPETTQN